MHRRNGSTLLESLMVVILISLLVASATPALQQGWTRARVARAHNDLRVVSQGIEMYLVDHATFPVPDAKPSDEPGTNGSWTIWPRNLTSPIPYMLTLPPDIFRAEHAPQSGFRPFGFERATWMPGGVSRLYVPVPLNVVGTSRTDGSGPVVSISNEWLTPRPWVIYSLGPDGRRSIVTPDGIIDSRYHILDRYDPTNGVVSPGNLSWFADGPAGE